MPYSSLKAMSKSDGISIYYELHNVNREINLNNGEHGRLVEMTKILPARL